MEKNIQMNILDKDLCCGCGACVGICPVTALKTDGKSFKPILDKSKCVDCGLCYDVCPGKGWNPVKQAKEICEREKIEMDIFYGPVTNYYRGKAADKAIHLAGASGGVGTSLLLYLLERHIVDDVCVVILNNGVPEVRITNDPDIIKKASGSKYSPAPVMAEVIKELRKRPRKMAITVIPCQMAALENAIQIAKKPELRELIFAIGLFCGNLSDHASVEKIANNLNITENDDAEFLGWRYGKWPGKATFKLKNGEIREKEYQEWLGISLPFYALHRCLMCPARENWLADIALADNHKGYTNQTLIVARTKKGDELLQSAQKDKVILLEEMNKNKSSDEFHITLTKFGSALTYINYRERKKLPVPSYDYDYQGYLNNNELRLRALIGLIRYRLFIIVRKRAILDFIEARPELMQRLGYFINRFPYNLKKYCKSLKIGKILAKNRDESKKEGDVGRTAPLQVFAKLKFSEYFKTKK